MDLSPLEKKLTELKSLHERGLIDAEDYKEEKRKALQGLGENSREHAAPPLHKIKPAAPNDAAPPSEAPNGGSLESEDKYDIVVKEQCGDETTLRGNYARLFALAPSFCACGAVYFDNLILI